MREVGVHEAKTHLSKLLREVEAGSEVVILRSGKAVARIVSVPATAARVLGSDRGVLVVPDDFDAPLPESVLDAFES
ncbi:MAG: type II toxin-antitoxin system Phd/YefM family antitoxin [Trueperaceae bacterium]|nr:MAG: type II toxin-antitoxin system Phd/YefM family antitoxin [Trueperaceae bacterium]